VGPGEGRRRARDAVAGADPLRQRPGRGRGPPQVGEQAQRHRTLAERGEAPGRPGGGGRPRILAAVPAFAGNDSESPAATGEPQHRPACGPVEGALREGLDRPGGRGVEPGRGVARPAHQKSRRSGAVQVLDRRLAGGDRVTDVVASLSLPVVGESSPVHRRRQWKSHRASGDRHPAPRVPLRAAPANGSPAAVETSRGAEVQAEQEAHRPLRLGPIADGVERERNRRRIARPRVSPTVAGAGSDGAAVPIDQGAQDEQRALVHPLGPGRGPRPQRPGPPQPATVAAGGGSDRHPGGPVVTAQAPPCRGFAGAQPDACAWAALSQAPQDKLPSGAEDPHAHRPEARGGDDHVRARAVALRHRVRGPQGPWRAAAEGDPGHDPGVGRHRSRRLPVARVVDQRPPSRPRPQVDHIPVGIDRPRQHAVPDHRRSQERRRHPRQPPRRPRIRLGPPGNQQQARPRHGRQPKRCPDPSHAPMQSAPAASLPLAFPKRTQSRGTQAR
jgi:hypothetical protein